MRSRSLVSSFFYFPEQYSRDVTQLYGTDAAGIDGGQPVIAHEPVFIRAEGNALVRIGVVLGVYIGFIQPPAIDENHLTAQFHLITGQADDPGQLVTNCPRPGAEGNDIDTAKAAFAGSAHNELRSLFQSGSHGIIQHKVPA